MVQIGAPVSYLETFGLRFPEKIWLCDDDFFLEKPLTTEFMCEIK